MKTLFKTNEIEMAKCEQTFVWISLLFVYLGVAVGVVKASDAPVPFSAASIRFEQNVTDRDVEVVFEMEGSDEGMRKLVVTSPDDRAIIDFSAPDASAFGIRKFLFESPEPRDIESLKLAYPEGIYTFTGVTAAGDNLHSETTLRHTLPATVSNLKFETSARGVGTRDKEITWTPVKDAAAYLIEIEHEESNFHIKANLPGSGNAFAVPDGLLLPGEEYKLSVGTLSDEGNMSFVETIFMTAGK